MSVATSRRIRKSPEERRTDILQAALGLFEQRGFGNCQMEDIRAATGLSRGGLYHHFGNKASILGALVDDEVRALEATLLDCETPLLDLVVGGSGSMGAPNGVLTTLSTREEMELYLACVSRSIRQYLRPLIAGAVADGVGAGRYADVNPEDAAELFIAVNAHINGSVLLGAWSNARAARFAALSLRALAELLQTPELGPAIQRLEAEAGE